MDEVLIDLYDEWIVCRSKFNQKSNIIIVTLSDASYRIIYQIVDDKIEYLKLDWFGEY